MPPARWVTKVHVEAVNMHGGYSIILIGHHDHDEVMALWRAPEVTQVVAARKR